VSRTTIALAVALLAGGAAASARARTIRPAAFTCQEFLALDPAVQTRLVYWMDGLARWGKIEDAEVDLARFDRPVTIVVEQCRKAPLAPLLEKMQVYFGTR
jgi:acid stress chaperone HdeA